MATNAPRNHHERLNALKQALAEQGVALRSDSSLCKCYIDGFLDPAVYDASTVAHVCALHKFLYTYTSYSADCHATLPQLAARLAGPLGGWNAAWSYVKEFEAPIVKAAAIEAVGGIPSTWPWLRHAEKELEEEMEIGKDFDKLIIDEKQYPSSD
jgi:hypothetical protein